MQEHQYDPQGQQEDVCMDTHENNSFAAEPSEFQAQLEQCRLSVQEWQNRFSYLSADFENYKRRVVVERATSAQLQQAEIVRKLLPVIDGMERAFAAKPAGSSADVVSWAEGLRMVYQSFEAFLRDLGVEEIPTSGQFNPEMHEALSQVETHGQKPGSIVAVLQKGYILKGVVLRPSLVNVAQ